MKDFAIAFLLVTNIYSIHQLKKLGFYNKIINKWWFRKGVKYNHE